MTSTTTLQNAEFTPYHNRRIEEAETSLRRAEAFQAEDTLLNGGDLTHAFDLEAARRQAVRELNRRVARAEAELAGRLEAEAFAQSAGFHKHDGEYGWFGVTCRRCQNTGGEPTTPAPGCREHQPDTGESYCEAHPDEGLVVISRQVACPVSHTRFRGLKRTRRTSQAKAVARLNEREYRTRQHVEGIIGSPTVTVKVVS